MIYNEYIIKKEGLMQTELCAVDFILVNDYIVKNNVCWKVEDVKQSNDVFVIKISNGEKTDEVRALSCDYVIVPASQKQSAVSFKDF